MKRERAIEICKMTWAKVLEQIDETPLEELTRNVFMLKDKALEVLVEEGKVTEDEYYKLDHWYYCALCVYAKQHCKDCPGIPLFGTCVADDDDDEEVSYDEYDTPCENAPDSPYAVVKDFIDSRYGVKFKDQQEYIDFRQAVQDMATFDYK